MFKYLSELIITRMVEEERKVEVEEVSKKCNDVKEVPK